VSHAVQRPFKRYTIITYSLLQPIVLLDIVGFIYVCVYDIIVFIYYVCISNSICHSVRLSHLFNKGYLLACLVTLLTCYCTL